ELPSQQPPDWWNISGPCIPVRRRSRSAAASVSNTFSTMSSEETELGGAVADQQVLGLLVVVEHHLVVLPADAGVLVPAERRVGGVRVVVVRPHPSGLDLPAGAVRRVDVA